MSVRPFYPPRPHIDVPVAFNVREAKSMRLYCQALDLPMIRDLNIPEGTQLHRVVGGKVTPWLRHIMNGEMGWLAMLSVADRQGNSGRGVGKSYIASSIFHALGDFSVGRSDYHLSWQPRGKYYPNPAEFIADVETSGGIVSRAIGCKYSKSGHLRNRIVVLDDFSVGITGALSYVSDRLQERTFAQYVHSLFDHCLHERIIIVLTANMTRGQLADFIGLSAWERFKEVAVFAEFRGVPNHRSLMLSDEMADIRAGLYQRNAYDHPE